MTAPRVRLLAVGLVREPDGAPIPQREVRSPDDAAKIARAMLPEDREGFVVLHLDGRHVVRSAELVSVGSLNASIVHPREVFKAAILANAAALILAHNHPSGSSEPSDEDLAITRRLVEAGEMLGIEVLDHLIIGDKVTSLRDSGLGIGERRGRW